MTGILLRLNSTSQLATATTDPSYTTHTLLCSPRTQLSSYWLRLRITT